jgi:hypothetical protein
MEKRQMEDGDFAILHPLSSILVSLYRVAGAGCCCGAGAA